MSDPDFFMGSAEVRRQRQAAGMERVYSAGRYALGTALIFLVAALCWRIAHG